MAGCDPVILSQAMIGRLKQLQELKGWTDLLSEPSPMPAPAYVVETDPAKGADYAQAMGDLTMWSMRIGLFNSAIDQKASLLSMAPLLGTRGPIVRALKDVMCDYDDDLSRLALSVVPTSMSGFRIVRMNHQRYRRAYIMVTVGTN